MSEKKLLKFPKQYAIMFNKRRMRLYEMIFTIINRVFSAIQIIHRLHHENPLRKGNNEKLERGSSN